MRSNQATTILTRAGGLTAILGKMISLPAAALVWWRMLLVSATALLLPRVWRNLRALPRRLFAVYAGIGVVVALHWLGFYGAIKLANASVAVTSMALCPIFLALIEPWVWPSTSALLLLTMAGIGLVGGNYWIVVAMRTGEIAAVAPFRYSATLWAIAAGFVVWRELPDLWTWTGIAIVTAAGVYTILRESRLRAPAAG